MRRGRRGKDWWGRGQRRHPQTGRLPSLRGDSGHPEGKWPGKHMKEVQIGLNCWKVLELGWWGGRRSSGSAGRDLDDRGLGMGLGAMGNSQVV